MDKVRLFDGISQESVGEMMACFAAVQRSYAADATVLSYSEHLGSIGVVETTRPVNMAAMQDFFVRRGVWIRPFNRLVYVMPPYVSPREDVERLCAAMHDVLSLPGMLA